MALTFALLAFAVASSGGVIAYLPVFGQNRSIDLSVVDLLSEGDIAVLKANRRGRIPDVGIFGNSRSVQLSADDIGVSREAFFNYSVPGGSFRQSVNLIEALSGHAALPETIIVSVDHFELAFMSRAPFPSGPQRWLRAGEDVSWVLRERGLKLAAHSLLDHLHGEWDAFSGAWNVARHWGRARLTRSGLFAGVPSGGSRWRPDGSRLLVVGGQPDLTLTPKHPFILHEVYLLRDLERTSALAQRSGTRVILYESPIVPLSDALIRSSPSAAAKRLRDRFLEQCGKLQLECYASPELGVASKNAPWGDCCHAPAQLLGRFVGSLI